MSYTLGMILGPRNLVLFLIVLILAGHVSASGQVGSALIATPWAPGQTLQVTGYVIGQSSQTQAEDGLAGEDLGLTRAVTFGRYRTNADDPAGPSVGWLADHTELNTDDPLLPARLVNLSGAVAGQLGQGPTWTVNYSLGAGVASDDPFADGDGVFGIGSLSARRALTGPTFLTLFIDYDGSRAFLPDVPLPALQYTVIESPTLTYSLGLPFSSLSWQPNDRWSVDARVLVVVGGSIEVSYRIDRRWQTYYQFESTTRGFHLDDGPDNQRLFLSQSRSEFGVRWEPRPGLEWNAAVGLTFGQEFNRGFDTRDLELVREVDNAVFLRLGVKANF